MITTVDLLEKIERKNESKNNVFIKENSGVKTTINIDKEVLKQC
mgnify:CR=1 FL=1